MKSLFQIERTKPGLEGFGHKLGFGPLDNKVWGDFLTEFDCAPIVSQSVGHAMVAT